MQKQHTSQLGQLDNPGEPGTAAATSLVGGDPLPAPLARSRITFQLEQQVVEGCGPLEELRTSNPQCQGVTTGDSPEH